MRGHAVARHNLGVREWNEGDTKRALKHWLVAAGGGNECSLNYTQRAYLEGISTKTEYKDALRAFQNYKDEMKSEQRDKAEHIY